MKLNVLKHLIVCSMLALSNTTNSLIQTSIIKLNVLMECRVEWANIIEGTNKIQKNLLRKIRNTLSFIIDVCIAEFVVLDGANTEHTIKCLNTYKFIKDIFNSSLKIIVIGPLPPTIHSG